MIQSIAGVREQNSSERAVSRAGSLRGVCLPSVMRRLDRQALTMMQVFRNHGGVVCGDELAYLVRLRSGQPISVVARWIVGREVVSFEWQSQTLLPLFQFDPSRMALRPCVAQIVRNLVDAYDDWEVAAWFASPNGWLGGATPVERVGTHAAAVLEAALADRFIARG